MHRPPVVPLLSLALALATGCQQPARSVPESPLDPAAPEPATPEPSTPEPATAEPEPEPIALPEPTGCAVAPRLTLADLDAACAIERPPIRALERLDRDGCVVERFTQTFDAAGRPLRTERRVFDADAVAHLSTYEVPASRIVERVYDADGRPIEERVDAGGDGTVDRVQRWVFDGPGEWVEHTDERGGVEAVTRRAYDAAGRLTNARTVSPGRVVERRFTYDAEGRRVRLEMWLGGALLGVTAHVYDAAGRAVEETVTDTTTDQIETTRSVYDEAGLAERVWTRARGERVLVEERWRYTRRADGALTEEVVEHRSSQIWREVRTYDADGELLRSARDIGLDGRVDTVRERRVEDDGRTVVYRTLDGDRATAHRIERYDAAGRLVEREDVIRGDRLVSEYDEAGRAAREARYGPEGLRASTVWDYPVEGDAAARRTDFTGPDEVPSRVTAWARDAAGRVRTARIDHDADGRWDVRSDWRFDAAGNTIHAAEGLTDDGEEAGGLFTLTDFHCVEPHGP